MKKNIGSIKKNGFLYVFEHFIDAYKPAFILLIAIIAIGFPFTSLASRANQRIVLYGDIPSPLNAPSGCPFRTRCAYATEVCAEAMPSFNEVSGGHFVACHRVNEIN